MTCTGRWALPAVPSSIAALRNEAVDWAACAGLPRRRLPDVRLAVSEAVTNAVLHAFTGQPAGTVSVEGHAWPDGLVLAVRDDGCGLRPRPDSPGLGLGLPMIATVTDRLEAHIGDPGTCIELHFDLPSRQRARRPGATARRSAAPHAARPRRSADRRLR
jgi:serine/threonine-protein kinase RsbW/stage II sporulation protein AB (anti-sigma F factor)